MSRRFSSLRSALVVLLLTPLAALHAADSTDLFAPYLDGKAPEILREVASTNTTPENITVRRVVFRSRDDSEIFALVATPKTTGKHPGMLVLHGGGGSAAVDQAMAWAQRGYVAVAPDLPGIADPKKLTDTKGKWSASNYGEGRWVATPDASASGTFDAVLAAMKALYLLRAQPEVDPSRIGVVGISWGGYMTTMVCGLAGDQVRAGFAIYGCGFFDLGKYGQEKKEAYNPKLPQTSLGRMPLEERERWLSQLDAGRRVPHMKAAYFLAAATNDFFGYASAAQATLDAIPGEKNHVFAPNANHKIPLPGGSVFEKSPAVPFTPTAFQPYPTPSGGKANWLAMEVPYFDHHLKGIGQPFPKVSIQKTGDPHLARVSIVAPHPLTNVEVYWAKATPADPSGDDLLKREWIALPATRTADDFHEAKLPAEAADWFAVVSDDRPVTVSSDLIHIGKVPGLPAVSARSPAALVPLNPASPNFSGLFSRSVKIGNPLAEPSAAKASHEMLLAVYAYLSPSSPAVGDPAYRDRLLVLLDDRCGRWAAGKVLADISCFWEASYAYYLLKSHEPAALSEARKTLYESALEKNRAYILNEGRLLYDQGLLANLWLNGDIRLAKGVYFGALARNDDETAEKARRAIDTVMTRSVLGDGATRYVGFWGEIASYHDEAVRELLWWWLITGSPSAKAAVDATLRYTVVATEPDGFTEQSSNIPYKHMYNNRNARESALWKAYLHNEGYNYYFGAPAETAGSNDLLNAILYQPSRVTRTPPSDVGAFFDANIQGPRGRFGGSWGWIAHGRDVQKGGPEHHELIAEQGHAGRQGGKTTFVGAFALGPIENKTSLKGALDSALVEFKESAGPETDLMRGNAYRYLAQDEQTRTITRRNFGTLSTSYRISRRISSPATPNWDAGRTPWLGQQLWVLTGKRIIGLMQILSDSDSTVYGLDARLVFTGGRKGIMGSYHELTQPDRSTFVFGDLRAKIHESTFTETITQQRIAISDAKSTDDFSALVRIPATAGDDAPVAFPAGTRRWIVTEITRDGHDLATDVKNLLPDDATWAALQMDEGDRRIQIVQNLTSSEQTYRGDVVAGSSLSATSLHRSWSESVTHLDASTGKATLTETIPAYGHLVAVSSKDPEDHRFSHRGSEEVYGKVVPITTPEN